MSEVTITEQLVEQICRDIRNGRYLRGEILPPVDELAAQAQCSAHTVRRALRSLAQAGIVRGVQRRGTVVLRQPSLGRVCLLLSNDDHTNQILQRDVCEALLEAGCDLDVIPPFHRSDRAHEWCQRLSQESNHPRCLVSLGQSAATSPDSQLEIRSTFNKHVFFVLDSLPRPTSSNDYYVAMDPRIHARCVVQHLLEAGHRHVAVFAGLDPGLDPDGFYGTVAAYAKDLLEITGGRCSLYYQSQGPEHFLKLIRNHGVTAFWDLNDSRAVQTMNFCYQQGIRIPADLTLIGRHDTPWCQQCVPALTSVSVNPPAVGEAIAQAVTTALSAANGHPHLTQVPSLLTVRQSSGSPRSELGE